MTQHMTAGPPTVTATDMRVNTRYINTTRVKSKHKVHKLHQGQEKTQGT